MRKLLVIIVSWNRPEFLHRTISSLFQNVADLPHDVIVIDNGSDSETEEVLSNEKRLAGCHLLEGNRGINAAIEFALDNHLTPDHRWILVSDADMEYRLCFYPPIELLKSRPEIGAVSFQHSPEHSVFETLSVNGRQWPLKRVERGCSLLFRSETLQRMRPLPVHNLKDFDWWICRDAPASLQSLNQPIAVYVGGAIHLGWRKGDSTWQDIETPEYHEIQNDD